VEFLKEFQEKFNKISDEEVVKILQVNAKKAGKLAAEKMLIVKKKIGLLV